MKKKKRLLGVICGMLTGCFWGISGVFSQYLFAESDMNPGWFVAVRMLIAGVVLMIYVAITESAGLMSFIRNKKDVFCATAAGIIGTMMFQFFCYGAVKESNAPTAIVLQYLCPVFIIVIMCFLNKELPKRVELLSIVLACLGIFLISTHADIHELVLTSKTLFLGIGSALFMALASILPAKLYTRHSVQTVTAWMLMCGGIVGSVIEQPLSRMPELSLKCTIALGLAILLGSVFAYMCYALSIKYVGPANASLCACVEIPASTILAVAFLGNRFTFWDILGFLSIMSTIFITSGREVIHGAI